MTIRSELTAERLRELLHYDPDMGVFTWIARSAPRGPIHVGDVAGCDVGRGYWGIQIDGRRYLTHRLAWLYMMGAWPIADIDHKNMRPADNRWCNLREATRSQNCANRGAHRANASGFKGVSWAASAKKWVVHIKYNGKRHHLGVFDDIKTAMLVYNAAAWLRYGKFAKLDPGYILEFKRWRALRNLANHTLCGA